MVCVARRCQRIKLERINELNSGAVNRSLQIQKVNLFSNQLMTFVSFFPQSAAHLSKKLPSCGCASVWESKIF